MSLRIGHCSDLHIDERGRLDDTVAVLNAFVEQAGAADVNIILVAGDVFERRSTPRERNAFADFLQGAAAVAPVVVAKGNHDAAEDLDVFGKIEARYPIYVFDRPTAQPDSALEVGHFGVLALPWFDKANLLATLDATVDAATSREMTISAARDLLTCVRAEASRVRATGAVPILVGHVLVGGSEVSTGQTLIGTSVELAPADLADVGAAYVALGHVHKSQTWLGGRVAYSGSPNRCNFGEPEAKGWRLVTLTDQGDFVSNEFRELPARRMVLVEEDWTDGDGLRRVSGYDNVAGALVRWRYRIRAEDLHLVDEAAIRSALLKAGAEDVQIEAVVAASTRVRAAAIATVTSVAEKVDAYLKAKNITLDEPARERVHGKLAALEAR